MSRLKTGKKGKLLIAAVIIAIVFVSTPYLAGSINKVVKKATEIDDYSYMSQTLLGFNGEKHILLLLMNNAEARFGGGFIGTVGYVTTFKGSIKVDPIRSVYYYDRNFQIVNYRENSQFQPEAKGTPYNLRDGNQNLDWRYNGKRAEKIFEQESSKPVDMVVAITPEVLKFLLAKLGPLEVPEYKKTVTQDNLLESVQTEVEYGDDKKDGKDPKTILSYVAEGVLQKLQAKSINDLISLAKKGENLVGRKQIVMYSGEKRLARILNEANLDGALARTTSDFFIMGENNYSIDKSNAFIDRILKRDITILPNGSAQVSISINRKQNRPISYEYIDPHAPDIVTNLIRANKSSIHFALPKNSKIISRDGDTAVSKISSESGYDIYSFNSELEPLVVSDYRISYLLPFMYDMNSKSLDFASIVQIQVGGWPYRLIESITLPDGWALANSSKSELRQNGSTSIYDNIVDKDQFFNFTYEKQ